MENTMDAKTCLQKLKYVGVLAFATVDSQGAPQIRNISAIHYENEAMYFFTARGKEFCSQLLSDGRVQVLGCTKYKEMIRLSARAEPVPAEEQKKWIDTIFEEQPTFPTCIPAIQEISALSLKSKTRKSNILISASIPFFAEPVQPGTPASATKVIKLRKDVSAAENARKSARSAAYFRGLRLSSGRNSACTAEAVWKPARRARWKSGREYDTGRKTVFPHKGIAPRTP